MKTSDFIKKMQNVMDLSFPFLRLKTELTLEAVKHNENIINNVYPFGHQPLFTTVLPIGFHLGETIIRMIPGAKWEEETGDNLEELKIIIPVKYDSSDKYLKIMPIGRVLKYWTIGREYSLSCLINTTVFLSENDLSDPKYIEQADEDGWFQITDGDFIRITMVPKTKKEDIN